MGEIWRRCNFILSLVTIHNDFALVQVPFIKLKGYRVVRKVTARVDVCFAIVPHIFVASRFKIEPNYFVIDAHVDRGRSVSIRRVSFPSRRLFSGSVREIVENFRRILRPRARGHDFDFARFPHAPKHRTNLEPRHGNLKHCPAVRVCFIAEKKKSNACAFSSSDFRWTCARRRGVFLFSFTFESSVF